MHSKFDRMPSVQYKYVAFLRGINVGGHHKLPMSELKSVLSKLGCQNVITFLNSGNAVFEHASTDAKKVENTIADSLKSTFGFDVPTIVLRLDDIRDLWAEAPFDDIEMTKDIRRYITFSNTDFASEISTPWQSEDTSFRILHISKRVIISVLDLSINKTPAAMKILEDTVGKNITTRNWNTIERIVKKVQVE